MAMFRSKKLQIDEPSVQELAGQLGIERRLNFRVNYPERTTAGLPLISFGGHAFRVQDLSTGGCCLIDVGQALSGKAGHEIELEMNFEGTVERVSARLLTLVNDRRHIQFSNLSERRQDQLRTKMMFGVRGAGLKSGLRALSQGPSILAREMWNSLQGDSLIFEMHSAREAVAEIAGDSFSFFPQAWPRDRFDQLVLRDKLNGLILFLANVPSPSPATLSLMRHLEDLSLGDDNK